MKIINFIIDNSQHNLTIDFSASKGVTNAQLSFEYLRICSPENSTKKLKSGQVQVTSHKKDVTLISIESVAKHGYRLIFSDGHNAIYSEVYIHTLAIEYEARWQSYLNDLKATGHSREAMIEIKQL
ncbi:gamma-butyrobetaine hydroxylase-like domain-containing protein [Colwellia piezophila]|uniref:gamma-butyrobetaine hydroxylase-like domain-containing protein n=1 Tax=Colwellia piezophila TaxID=211668 RepID=UPI000360B8A8|nr:gamma-butyrobetaine hydroxylase-like domain-containing protein [Colwellia piezophila]